MNIKFVQAKLYVLWVNGTYLSADPRIFERLVILTKIPFIITQGERFMECKKKKKKDEYYSILICAVERYNCIHETISFL